MTLMFLYFLKEKEIYKNCIDITNGIINEKNISLVFVNDMDYSGNQATGSYKRLFEEYRNEKMKNNKTKLSSENLNLLNAIKKGYKIDSKYEKTSPKFKKFIKLSELKEIVKKPVFRNNLKFIFLKAERNFPMLDYVHIRAFQSEYTYQNFKNYNKNQYNKFLASGNITSITGEVITNFENQVKLIYPNSYKQRQKLVAYYWTSAYVDYKFEHDEITEELPKVNVYFDHKIADTSSTFIIPFTTGMVLNYKNKTPTKRFYALINKCKYGENLEKICREMNYNIDSLIAFIDGNRMNKTDLYKLIRCPYTWYYTINWDTGKMKKD